MHEVTPKGNGLEERLKNLLAATASRRFHLADRDSISTFYLQYWTNEIQQYLGSQKSRWEVFKEQYF
jgi:hypothetical protein